MYICLVTPSVHLVVHTYTCVCLRERQREREQPGQLPAKMFPACSCTEQTKDFWLILLWRFKKSPLSIMRL